MLCRVVAAGVKYFVDGRYLFDRRLILSVLVLGDVKSGLLVNQW